MSFENNLRKLRLNKSITQTELAQKLHLSRTAISNYENGKVQPSLDTLIKISEIFEITIDELMQK